jgi:hypothetical protein
MPLKIGPSDEIMGCGGAQLGSSLQHGPSGYDSGFTKGPNHGSYRGHD